MTRKSKQKRRNQRKQATAEIPRTSFTVVNRQSTPIPQRFLTKLTYADNLGIAGVAIKDYQFRLNSLYDPDFTGTGHQPKGFDQLAALYQRYRVYRVRYKFVFTNIGSTTNPVICAVVPTNAVTGYTLLSDAIEQTGSKWISFLSSVGKLNTVQGVVDLPKLNGKSYTAYAADDTTQALNNTNPAEVLQLHIVMGSSDGSTNVSGYIDAQLWFDCEFSDPIQLGQS